MKKSTIIIIVVSVIILTGIIFGMLLTKDKKTEVKEPPVITFSNNFIKDFSTYKVTEEVAYNEKVLKYIDQTYKTDFSDTYKLPKSSFLPESKKGNYSQYLESTSNVLEETERQAKVRISYKTKKLDAPAKPIEFTETKTVDIIIKKSGKNFTITKFTFSSNE